MISLSGAVLAGGASSRMGRDKALIEVDGKPLVVRGVDALRRGGAVRVVVVGGNDHAWRTLGLDAIPDTFPGQGPLGGIISALQHSLSDTVAVLSCDLVNPSGLAVRAVAERLGPADVAVPLVGGHHQWLHSVWRRGALGELAKAFSAGERAPRRAVENLTVVQVLDGDPAWYADADYPDDLPVRVATIERHYERTDGHGRN